MYIYIADSVCFLGECKKYGYTTNPRERLSQLSNSHSRPCEYVKLWKIVTIPKHCKGIVRHDDVVTRTLDSSKHSYDAKKFNGGGGTEFFTGDPDIIKQILEDQGYELEEVTLEDTDKLQRDASFSPKKTPHREVLGIDDTTSSESEPSDLEDVEDENESECETGITIAPHHEEVPQNTQAKDKIVPRDYQQEAIEYGAKSLATDGRIYIELPTGAGKTVIMYHLFKEVQAPIIFILSPRKIVNQQNIKKDYQAIIEKPCHIYNLSTDGRQSFDKFYRQEGVKIIVGCIQSAGKVCRLITKYNMQNVFMCFDEAHWGIENSLAYAPNVVKQMLLESTQQISQRLFLSASPDRDIVQQNKHIFGELYRPVKVSDMIAEGWLCPIRPYVFGEDKVNVDVVSFMFNHFKQHNKHHAFSFHYCQMSAFRLFHKHLAGYLDGTTDVKPFLLVSDFDIPRSILPQEEQGEYTSLETFERTPKSLGYVVAQYSMGYDFNKIDMICFSDPKMAPKDIIQSIGRGTRPDQLGIEGRNKDKFLDVLLPVFQEDDSLDKFQRIREVLLYLVNEVELQFGDIIFVRPEKKKDVDEILEVDKVGSNGVEVVRSILLGILRGSLSHKGFIKLLRQYDIHTTETYYEFRDRMMIEKPEIELPEYPFSAYPDLTWESTYFESPFYSKKEFMARIGEVLESLEDDDMYIRMEDEDEKIGCIHNIDNRVPKEPYWRFYGGNKKDYTL